MGFFASDGIIQTRPTFAAPAILPCAQSTCTRRFEIPHFFAVSDALQKLGVLLSIFHSPRMFYYIPKCEYFQDQNQYFYKIFQKNIQNLFLAKSTLFASSIIQLTEMLFNDILCMYFSAEYANFCCYQKVYFLIVFFIIGF